MADVPVCHQNRNPYVMVLVDGDGLLVSPPELLYTLASPLGPSAFGATSLTRADTA